MWLQSDSMDSQAGASNQDKVHGGDISGGQAYTYDSSDSSCQQEYNSNGNGFKPASTNPQTFTWKVTHSMVNVSTERGTEHGLFTLQNTSAWAAGFNGHINDYDFPTSIAGFTTPRSDATGTTQTDWYESAGNFNTHGGAESGAHYRGNYTVLIYQDSQNNSPCMPNSQNYCFQAITDGQVN